MNMQSTSARHHSLIWTAGSILLFLVIVAVLWVALPWDVAPSSATERVINTVIQLRWPVLVLLLMVVRQFRIFDTDGAADPLAGAESRRFKVNRQVLQNSMEQFVLFAPTILAFAALAGNDVLWRLVPIAVFLFTAGRLLFWLGYNHSAQFRAPGFAMTFGATFCSLLLVFYLAF